MGSPQWRGGGLSDTQPHLQVLPGGGTCRKRFPPPPLRILHVLQALVSSLPLPLLPHREGAAPFWGQMADLRWGTWRQVQTPEKQGLSHPLEFPYLTLQRTLVSYPIL